MSKVKSVCSVLFAGFLFCSIAHADNPNLLALRSAIENVRNSYAGISVGVSKVIKKSNALIASMCRGDLEGLTPELLLRVRDSMIFLSLDSWRGNNCSYYCERVRTHSHIYWYLARRLAEHDGTVFIATHYFASLLYLHADSGITQGYLKGEIKRIFAAYADNPNLLASLESAIKNIGNSPAGVSEVIEKSGALISGIYYGESIEGITAASLKEVADCILDFSYQGFDSIPYCCDSERAVAKGLMMGRLYILLYLAKRMAAREEDHTTERRSSACLTALGIYDRIPERYLLINIKSISDSYIYGIPECLLPSQHSCND